MSTTQNFDETALANISRVGGEDLVQRLIALFFENAPTRLNDARVGVRCGDLEAVKRAVHSLKSTAGQLGAVSLQIIAGDIEQFAENDDAAAVSERFRDLASALTQAEVYLEEKRKSL